RSLLALGIVARRAKRRGEARIALESAEAIFTAIRSTAWTERTRGELDRTGQHQNPGALTPTERQIAVLIGAGRSNLEIAAELHLAIKTIETTLTVIYRKTGTTRRTQLAAHILADGNRLPLPATLPRVAPE